MPVIVLALFLLQNAGAHEAGNLNEFTIDRTNNDVASQVLEVQRLLSEIIRGNREVTTWPARELITLRDDFNHLKHDTDLSLDYLANAGVNLQRIEELKANPLAGRSVSASRAVETCIALLEHIASLENREAFVKEVYSRSLAYYMYDLLDAYRDKMDLYGELMGKGN